MSLLLIVFPNLQIGIFPTYHTIVLRDGTGCGREEQGNLVVSLIVFIRVCRGNRVSSRHEDTNGKLWRQAAHHYAV